MPVVFYPTETGEHPHLTILTTILAMAALSQGLTGEAAYKIYFQGLYAVGGACDRIEALWDFAPETVTQGRQVCDIYGFDNSKGMLIVKTRNCSNDGKIVPDVTYSLDIISLDLISVADGNIKQMVRQCPAR